MALSRRIVWLVLFDIDGTLVLCGRQIREIFATSMEAVFGTTGDLENYQFAGRTDDGIVFDLMTGAGFTERQVGDRLSAFSDLYLDRLERDLDGGQMRLLPGVEALLDRLTSRPDVVVGLLTGNWERGARIKLSRFDLNRFFTFGAFGDGSRSRDELPPIAIERARQVAGIAIATDRAVIVGDSVLDVRCAQAHGISSVAVATGFVPAAELERAGADWVIADLHAAAGCHPAFAPEE